jgi:hypothetical protein
MIDLQNHYWQLADGRIWSSSRTAFVPANDPVYVSWLAQDNAPTRAPDESGQVSEQGLRDALRFYGLSLGALASPEDLAATARSKRDALLAASDWTQLPDSPLSADARAAWATYRQALRDITDQKGFPGVIEWPEAPE